MEKGLMKKFNLIDKCNNDFNLNNGLLDIYLKIKFKGEGI